VAPRQISTQHVTVTCAVCGRSLLRGERADVFLHAGERRHVCELCTPRAVHEGWIREGADAAPGRARGWSRGSGVSFLERLRQRRRDHDVELLVPEGAESLVEAMDDDPYAVPPPELGEARQEEQGPPPEYRLPEEPLLYREDRAVHAIPTNADMKVARAIELFNVSQHPRTISGLSRTLGAPLISVRPSLTEGSIVTVVVAWELSWYRFEIDLADEVAGVRRTAQGAELDELEEADRTPNAVMDEHGVLHGVVPPA
jgi:hypothetical protein